MGIFDPNFIAEYNFYCDTYGLDTISYSTMTAFIMECYEAGILNDIGMEAKVMEYSEYVTKESLAQQGGYGIALKGAQHDEAWLIFMDMVNKQIPTFEDKAEALHYFPMWRTWLGLCDLCKLPGTMLNPLTMRKQMNLQKYRDTFRGTASSSRV